MTAREDEVNEIREQHARDIERCKSGEYSLTRASKDIGVLLEHIESLRTAGAQEWVDVRERLEAPLIRLRENIGFGLLTALRNGTQLDMDGCEVRVSRQACEEAADHLEQLAALPPPPKGDAT